MNNESDNKAIDETIEKTGSSVPVIKSIGVYQIPTWAMCPLMFGDFSGINDDDEKEVNDFVDSIVSQYGHFGTMDVKDDESYFTNYPAFGLTCDVQDVEIFV